MSNHNTGRGHTDLAAQVQLTQAMAAPTSPPPATSETDPVFAAWLAAKPPVSAFTNDASYLASPATADLSLANHNLVDVLSLAFGGNTILDLGGAQLKDGTPGGNSGAAISLRNRQLTNQYAMPLADWSGTALQDGLGNAFLTNLTGRNVSELANDAGYSTGAYTPADPSRWAGNPPGSLAAAIDRLAELASNHGANPIP